MGLLSGLGKSLSKGLKSFTKTLGNTGNVFSSAFSFFDSTQKDVEDAWDDYTGKNVALKNLKESQRQFDIQNALNERQFAYQRELNELQMQREDTAYQRKVADMTKAGFNPILATGGSGSPSSPLSSPSLRTAPAPSMPDYSGGVREALGSIFSLISMRKDFAVKDKQISLLASQKRDADASASLKEAETAFKNAETDRIKKELQYGDDYYRLRNEGMRLANDSKKLSNTLDSETLANKIALSAVELDSAKVKLYNSQLDSEIKRLGISQAQIDLEMSKLDYRYKGNIYRMELTAKSIAVAKALAEYNTYIWDVGYWHDRGLPSGTTIGQLPFLAKYANYSSGLISSAWKELKEGFNGFIDFSSFYNTISNLSSNFEEMVSGLAKSLGKTKDEVIASFRRPADGVRRNQYSVMFGL